MKMALVFPFPPNLKSPLNIKYIILYVRDVYHMCADLFIIATSQDGVKSHVLFSFTSFLIKSERCKQ